MFSSNVLNLNKIYNIKGTKMLENKSKVDINCFQSDSKICVVSYKNK